MKEDWKIIFVDIDWTILDHKIHDWDYESIDALKLAQKNGVLIFLCTARPYDSVRTTGLFEVFKPDGIISTNGEVGFVNDEIVFAENIPAEIVKQVNIVAHQYSLVLESCTEVGRYFNKDANEYVFDYMTRFQETVPEIRDELYDHVSALLLFSPEHLDAEIMPLIPSSLRYFRFDKCGVDLQYHPCSKGEGIKKILNYLKIDKSQSIAIGDDYGDIEMFKEVGLSIAVGNGKEEVKQQATYITDTVHEHGVKNALVDLKII